MIERIALDALALRAQLPELHAARGRRASSRASPRARPAHGVIVLAGVAARRQAAARGRGRADAAPEVAEVTPEQVTLRLDHAGDAAGRAGRRRRRAAPAAARRRRAAAPRRRRRRERDGRAGVRLRRARPARPAHRPRARERERARGRAARAPRSSSPSAAAGAAAGRARRDDRPRRRRCASRRAATRSTPMPERRAASPRCATRATGAPKVVASGQGHVAEKILAAAQAAGVPVREDPQLAEALGALALGQEVPGGAVAGGRRGARLGLRAGTAERLPRIGDVGVWTPCRYPLRPPP